MPEAVIVATARSPIGRANKGSLTELRPDDMSAQIVRALMAKVPQLKADDVEDLMMGCGQPAGEAGFNIARVVAVLAGLDQGQLSTYVCDFPTRAIKDHPRAGKARQPHKVDHDLVAGIMACDQAGQHAGVRRGRIGVDHCQAHAGQRVHRPHPQDQRMGMSTADQDHVLHKGKGVLHHRPSRPAARGCAVARTLGCGGGNGEGAGV